MTTTKLAECDRWALNRMNIPQKFWSSSYSEIAPELKEPVKRYINGLDAFLGRGTGFFIFGGPGTGKTSAGVVLLKAGWERYKTGYYTTVKDLRYSSRENETFDGTDSVMDRCRGVDILVLDNLGEDDFSNFTMGAGDIEHLLTTRAARAKTTVLLTKLLPMQIFPKAPNLLPSLKGQFIDVALNGPNRNDEASLQLKRELGVI